VLVPIWEGGERLRRRWVAGGTEGSKAGEQRGRKGLIQNDDSPRLSSWPSYVWNDLTKPRNLARSYGADIQPTLFGEWAVISNWGRIGTYGRTRQDWVSSLTEAQTAHSDRVTRKLRRGFATPPNIMKHHPPCTTKTEFSCRPRSTTCMQKAQETCPRGYESRAYQK
jgi:predicted DNA-binding WGR domain protein